MDRRRFALLGALALLLSLFVSLSACSPQATTSPGEALIQKGKCFACHAYPGNQAVTDEKLAPSFCRTQRRYWNGEIDRAYLRESIVNPKAQAGPMPADETPGPHTPTPWNPHLRIMPEGYADMFTAEEIDQIIDFIINLDCSTFTPGAPN